MVNLRYLKDLWRFNRGVDGIEIDFPIEFLLRLVSF